jgi:hypothetical protein
MRSIAKTATSKLPSQTHYRLHPRKIYVRACTQNICLRAKVVAEKIENHLALLGESALYVRFDTAVGGLNGGLCVWPERGAARLQWLCSRTRERG